PAFSLTATGPNAFPSADGSASGFAPAGPDEVRATSTAPPGPGSAAADTATESASDVTSSPGRTTFPPTRTATSLGAGGTYGIVTDPVAAGVAGSNVSNTAASNVCFPRTHLCFARSMVAVRPANGRGCH